jgi:hypothetical protein
MGRARNANLLAGIGVVGEAFMLNELLVNTYPYKVMHVPSAAFFEQASMISAGLALGLAVVVMGLAARRNGVFAPWLLAGLTPLLYALVVGVGTLGLDQHALVAGKNIDGVRGIDVVTQFIADTFMVAAAGFVVGLVCTDGVAASGPRQHAGGEPG